MKFRELGLLVWMDPHPKEFYKIILSANAMDDESK
jgi:hypothetical protein